ncbi:glycoside hydrolase family 5 protein [Uliginosibacterium sp. TH139]|uniref:glycoside hydrolase family 5 protein n=1 Tax=Uliginosibacterium sp. TH139 TaxID=2067453 RepID=UPI000C7B8196|nr:glycoside hydrolase family 5 protein [Uliginosibacterium sp. TH139]PLK48524.1 endoglucanase [Uliginosibacterium sp. TH139]
MHKILGSLLLAGCTLASSLAHAASASEITRSMMPGWNLGNALDAIGGETNWGNPKTTRAMIDKVRSAGFKSLRVPVSWDDYTSGSSYSIASTRLDRVEEVVNYGLANGMYVIINVHHHNGWEAPTYANQSTAKDRLGKLWQQIATRFKGYDEHLIFEVMNEPRSGEDWTGTAENYAVVNTLNAAALSTIRATGGNNASRLVMLPTYVAGPWDVQINALSLPADNMLAASIHAYIPYSFAMEYPGSSSFTDTALVDSVFAGLNTRFIAKGIPVVMGEWGTTNKGNYTERVKHAEYYVKAAAKLGIPVIVWDNNIFTTGGEAFGLLNRSTLSWTYPEIVTAIMQGASTMSGASSSAATSTASSSKAAASSSAASSSSKASSAASTSSAAASSVASSSKAASSATSSASTTPALLGTGDYPTGFSKCSAEDATCTVPTGTGWVAFGRKGKWVARNVGVGKSIACSVAAFGSNPGGNPNKCAYQK